MRLLLIEDDEASARAIGWALNDLGVDVTTLHAGKQAIGAIAHLNPDAVLVDIGLHDIDGVTLVGYIRDNWSRLPIVLASGHADFPGLKPLLRDARTAFLQKPFEIDDLVRAIEKMMSE